MNWLKWIVMGLALFQGGWLLFDGCRAMLVGDYVTASSGPRAGQLGPWSQIVAALGIEPRSTLMKLVHIVLGVAWLSALALFAWMPAIGWWAVLICGIASLWYLPIGTALSIIQIALLFVPQIRNLA